MPNNSPSPQPISAPANPSRPPPRKMSQSGSALRLPSMSSRAGASPMSFGAAMSGISFGNGGGGFSSFNRGGYDQGSYGARFYGDTTDSPHMPFSSSITMDGGSFAANSASFGLPIGSMSGSYGRRSYAMAVSLGKDYGAHMLSASLASLTTGGPMGSMSHSYSRGQLETLMTLRNEAEHTKEYECCGIKHNGLHALLEHVEDQHPYGDANMPDAGFSPVTLAMDLELEGDHDVPSATHSNRSSTSPRPVPNYPLTPTSATGPKPDPPAAAPSTIAPLQLSDVLKSPGVDDSTLALPNLGTSPNDITPTPTAGNSPTSPFAAPPKITPASRGAFLGGPPKSGSSRFDRAFNEVVAGNKNTGVEDASTATPPGPTAVAPGVLFTAAAALGMPSAPTVVGRQNGATGTPATPAAEETTNKEEKKEDADRPRFNMEPNLPQPSLFTTHKAWRCPNPGCNKAYKQSNGLKYHLQKGQCDFAIHDAIDHGLTLEEAEERSRPYVCAVGAGCTKRYRQMNGLKYHYLNSGEHGQYGLRMLQNGTHPHPPILPPVPKRDRAAEAAANASVRGNAAPYTVPSQAQRAAPTSSAVHLAGGQQRPAPRMGTWPTPQRPANGTTTTTTTATNVTAAQARPGAVAAATAAGAAQRPPAPAAPAAAPAAAPNAAATAAAAAAAAPKAAAQVQRGRDAVLFNVDPLDV